MIEREVLCQAAHKEIFVCGVRAAPPSLMPAVHAAGLRRGDGFQRRVAAFRSTAGWGIDGGGGISAERFRTIIKFTGIIQAANLKQHVLHHKRHRSLLPR